MKHADAIEQLSLTRLKDLNWSGSIYLFKKRWHMSIGASVGLDIARARERAETHPDCRHSWELMVKTPDSSKNSEMRRCPNPNGCPANHSESRLTKKGWWNVAGLAAAVEGTVVAVATYVDDDKNSAKPR